MATKRGAPKTRTYAENVKPVTREFTRDDNNKIQFLYRPGTSDDSVLHEILTTTWYRRKHLGFDVEQGEHWLDLGANIGGFALYCWFKHATAVCYEPQEENFKILQKNLQAMNNAHKSKQRFIAEHSAVTHLDDETVPFYRGRSPGDYARYTTDKTIYDLNEEVPNTPMAELLPRNVAWDGIKMDIEGAEHPIVDAEIIPPCKKLCFEYHIRKHPCMKDFQRRMKFLKSIFDVVHYAPSLDKGYPGDKYPGAFDRMIFCLNH